MGKCLYKKIRRERERMEKVVTAPAIIRIANTSEVAKTFQAYKENFTTKLAAGQALEFEVKTSGQVLYYLAQATTGLTVEVVEDYTSDDDTTTKLNVPALITLNNTSTKTIGFIPYRENFQYDIAGGDEVQLTATNVGQVLYYLAQATEGLEVTFAEVAAA